MYVMGLGVWRIVSDIHHTTMLIFTGMIVKHNIQRCTVHCTLYTVHCTCGLYPGEGVLDPMLLKYVGTALSCQDGRGL
jgi:hypothetical protein